MILGEVYRKEEITPQRAIKIVLKMIEDGLISNAVHAATEVQKLTGKKSCTEKNYEAIRDAVAKWL